MPKERDPDNIRIGTNIKFIKEASHLSWQEFAKKVGIGRSKLEKAEGGTEYFNDDELFAIEKNTGVPASFIKNKSNEEFKESLKKLFGNQLFFDGSQTAEKLLENESLFAVFTNIFESFFPFECDKKSMSSSFFSKAYAMCTSTEYRIFLEDDVNDVIQMFIDSLNEGVTRVVYVNLLSLLGRYYLIYTNGFEDIYEAKDVMQIKPKSTLELLNTIFESKRLKTDTTKKRRKQFFEKYGGLLEACCFGIERSKRYKEYYQFFTYVRYQMGIFEEQDPIFSTREYSVAMQYLLKILIKTRNKYALKLSEKISKNL